MRWLQEAASWSQHHLHLLVVPWALVYLPSLCIFIVTMNLESSSVCPQVNIVFCILWSDLQAPLRQQAAQEVMLWHGLGAGWLCCEQEPGGAPER